MRTVCLRLFLVGTICCFIAERNFAAAQLIPQQHFITAQPTAMVQLPNAAVSPPLNKPRHQLRMEVDVSWSEKAGYIPVKFILHRTVASPSDTTVTLHLQSYDPYRYYGPFGNDEELGTHVWKDVEIPADVMQVETTLATLMFGQGGFSWEVFVDGKLAEELGGESQSYGNRPYINSSSGLANILLVASATNAQTIADLALSMNPGMAQAQIDEIIDRAAKNAWQGSAVVEAGMRQLPPQAFPHRPIDYNSIDIIYVSVSDLKLLMAEKPAWQAIKEWIASGGNLWVVGAGDKWERVKEIDLAFGFAAEPDDPLARGWFSFDAKREKEITSSAWDALEVNHEARTVALLAQLPNQNSGTTSSLGSGTAATPVQAFQIDPPRILWHGYMLGQIGVFAAENPFAENPAYGGPGMSLTKRFPISSLFDWRESWPSRHGVWLGGGNEGFWNWLLPSVGLAPVTMFQILITLFVLAIGPLNFILLRRWKRLYLLLVTVPISAGLVTLGLFAYAFLTDGLSTRVRVRSFTDIDQTTGLAATWARLSYYSAIAPADGMQFPTDTIVIPLESEERNTYYRRSWDPFLELHWGKDAQYLKGDWLPSRTPVQYVTVRTRLSPLRLEVKADPNGVSVVNKLQANIRQLLVTDENGKFYWGEQIAPDGTTTLAQIDFDRARAQLAAGIQAEAPGFPAGMSLAYYGNGNELGAWRHVTEHVSNPVEATNSLLEIALDRIVSTEATSPDSIYGPGRFIAIVDQSPEVPLGLKEIEQQSSVQVITGRWK